MQEMGWRDVEEYKVVYGAPELWENGLYKMLRSKQSGFFTYWYVTERRGVVWGVGLFS